ncbi:phage tail protein [Streptomyces sp. UC4497]
MALKPLEVDPYRNFLFRVEVEGIIQAGFNEVSIGENVIAELPYRNGDEIPTVGKGAGLTKYGDVVLKWGLTDSRVLFDWCQRVMNGVTERHSVIISVLDSDGEPRVEWECKQAWPSKIKTPDLTASGTAYAIMTLTLCHHGVVQR